MADDRLRMIAEVEDRATGPLGRIRSALGGMSRDGVQHTTALRKGFEESHAAIRNTGGAIGAINPALASLSIAGFGAAAALGGTAVALRNFSQSSQTLGIVSKQTGLAVDSLRALVQMGDRVGLSSQTMLGAADNFARAGAKLKKNMGEAMQSLPAMNLGWLLQDLQSAKSAEEMMAKLFAGLPKISNVEARRRVLTMFFGTEDIDRIIVEFGAGVGEKFKEIRAAIGTLDPETQKAAKAFEDNMGRMGDAAEKLKLKLMGPIVKGVSGALGAINDTLETDPDDPRSRLKYLNRQRQSLDEDIARSTAGSFKRNYFENNRSGIEAEIRKLERAIEESTAKGAEKGVNRALKDNATPTVQQQSFTGGGFGQGGLLHRAALTGGGGVLRGGGYGAPSGGYEPPIPYGGSAIRVPRAALPRENGGALQDTGGPLSAGGPSPKGQGAREQRAMARLIARGWNPVAAATAVGQAVEESGVRSDGPLGDTARFGRGDAAAHGMFQWRDSRFRELKAFAEKRGRPWTDFDTQVDFFDQERKTRRNPAERNWHAETNFHRGNKTGMSFEGYAGGLQPQREAHARRLYRDWQRGSGATADASGAAGSEAPWHERPRSNVPGQMSRLRDDEIDVPGGGQRPGDAMMRRFYGDQAPSAKQMPIEGNATIDLRLHGFPAGTRAKTSMEGLFTGVTTSRHRAPEMEQL